MSVGNSANVLVGPASIRIAPLGTVLPDLTVYPPNWNAAWRLAGFTEKGTDMDFSASVKDITVDELRSPVGKIVDTEKGTISAVLAESTLQNIYDAIATATLGGAIAAGPTNTGSQKLSVGGGALRYVMVALEGTSPQGFSRVIVGYKALSEVTVKLGFQRTAMTTVPVQFGLVADTTRADGDNLFSVTDIQAQHT
jgi:hypothetical protein